MILVDIQVPALDRTYDFELDETLTVKKLTEKIIGIISHKENLQSPCTEEMYLFALGREILLNRDFSLKEQGIGTGEKLILI